MAMATFRKPHHRQHSGELEVQKRRNVPPQVSQQLEMIVQDAMPGQHSEFFAGLEYFAIATADTDGRPWATILTGKPGSFIHAASASELRIECSAAAQDPFVQCLLRHKKKEKKMLWAGLGVDFSNRRRNKVAGVVGEAFVTIDGVEAEVELRLHTNENMGNCPKYITVRGLQYKHRKPHCVSADVSSPAGSTLDQAALDIIGKASTIFLTTRHSDHTGSPMLSDIGLNHRGGPPGFVRTYSHEGATFLVLPDFSGNRFYQSLGNVQSDRTAGVVVPDFETGSLLHITGEAENIFDEEAQRLMPRVALVTRIRISGYVHLQGSLNLQLLSPEVFSPYNPPLRMLASELEALGRPACLPSAGDDKPSKATLVAVRRISAMVSSFSFQLDRPLENYVPGAYIILDLSAAIKVPYMHMNESSPQLVNDDLIRTWTISSVDDKTTTVCCTIKNQPSGTISPVLHSIERPQDVQLTLGVLGSACEFSCFSSGCVPDKMLWVAGGVGITPFLAMLEGLRRRPANTDIVFLFACRDDEVNLLGEIKQIPPIVQLRGVALQSGSKPGSASSLPAGFTSQRRRVSKADVEGVTDLRDREAFVCGPPGLEASVCGWLSDCGLAESRTHLEKFSF